VSVDLVSRPHESVARDSMVRDREVSYIQESYIFVHNKCNTPVALTELPNKHCSEHHKAAEQQAKNA